MAGEGHGCTEVGLLDGLGWLEAHGCSSETLRWLSDARLCAPSSMQLEILSTRSRRHLSASVPKGMAKNSEHRPSRPSSHPTMRLLPCSCGASVSSWSKVPHNFQPLC